MPITVVSQPPTSRTGPLIGTHDGSFHCDEALACAMLLMTDAYKDATIIRTRNPAFIDACDIVVDVGAVYDADRNRFDHHQITFDGTMETALQRYRTRLSSAGLVYKHFGQEVLRKILPNLSEGEMNVLYDRLYRGFIEHIDGVDNGVEEFTLVNPEGHADVKLQQNYRNATGLAQRVSRLNPRWNEPSSPDKENEQFIKAIGVTEEEFLDFVKVYGESWLPARSIVQRSVEARFSVHPSGLIVQMETFCPWQEHLYDVEDVLGITQKDKQVLYVLFADSRGSWRVQCVGEKGSKFANRRSLPQAWRGLRDDELSQKSGIDGCVFVHASGFIGGNQTFEGALKMAVQSLPEM